MSFDRVGKRTRQPFYYPIGRGHHSACDRDRPSRADDVIPHVKYDDKLMVGYRYWTTTANIRSSRSVSA